MVCGEIVAEMGAILNATSSDAPLWLYGSRRQTADDRVSRPHGQPTKNATLRAANNHL